MELVLTRFKFTPKFTIGFLTINGVFECFTCEDTVREVKGQPVEKWKVYGETAIPYGRYKVIINFSNRFKRFLPLLINVPGFEGIRMHIGNWAKDTEGCILPGETMMIDGVGKSVAAFTKLYAQLLNAQHRNDEIWITVKSGTWNSRK